MLETKVQSLKEELAGAHQIIGQQLHELQLLRQALQQLGVETVRVILRAQAFDPQGHLSPSFVLDEELSASLKYYTHSQSSITSQASFQDPTAPPPLAVKETTKNISTISSLSSSDFSRGSLHPVRVPFRRHCRRSVVESSLRGRRLSSLSHSERVLLKNHLQSTETASPHSNIRTLLNGQCTTFGTDTAIQNVVGSGSFFLSATTSNKSVLPSSTPKPTEGMNLNDEDATNLVVTGEDLPLGSPSDEVARPDVPLTIVQGVDETRHEENSSIDDRETLGIQSCDLNDPQGPPRPLSHTESQATTKASNTSHPSCAPASRSGTSATIAFPCKTEEILQRRKNFLAKASPTLVAPNKDEYPRGSPLGMKPPERVVSPIPNGGNCPRDLNVNVEGQLLIDAWGQEGVYEGTIDPKTRLPHGHGTIVYTVVAPTNTSAAPTPTHTYSGDWKQGKYHGVGKLQEAGHTYKGPFTNGVKHGSEEATMTFANGRCFIGRFQKDAMREGVLQYEDGSYYEGLLNNNKRNGFGFYRFSSGDQYEGLWKDDIM